VVQQGKCSWRQRCRGRGGALPGFGGDNSSVRATTTLTPLNVATTPRCTRQRPSLPSKRRRLLGVCDGGHLPRISSDAGRQLPKLDAEGDSQAAGGLTTVFFSLSQHEILHMRMQFVAGDSLSGTRMSHPHSQYQCNSREHMKKP
jgi:hypothetical protein